FHRALMPSQQNDRSAAGERRFVKLRAFDAHLEAVGAAEQVTEREEREAQARAVIGGGGDAEAAQARGRRAAKRNVDGEEDGSEREDDRLGEMAEYAQDGNGEKAEEATGQGVE